MMTETAVAEIAYTQGLTTIRLATKCMRYAKEHFRQGIQDVLFVCIRGNSHLLYHYQALNSGCIRPVYFS
jgi:hypothetical protein